MRLRIGHDKLRNARGVRPARPPEPKANHALLGRRPCGADAGLRGLGKILFSHKLKSGGQLLPSAA